MIHKDFSENSNPAPGSGKLTAEQPASWRDFLPIHPAANRIPEPTDQEKRLLAADLRSRGQRIEVVLIRVACNPDAGLQLIDGRTRLDLQEAAGVKVIDADGRLLVPHRVDEVQDDAEAEKLSLSLNVHRRHLNAEQRQNALIQAIARAPEKSDRQIGREIGVDHKTVAKARAKGEDVGRIPHVAERKDTKGRKQPAKKAREASKDREQPEQHSDRFLKKAPTRFPSLLDAERRRKLGDKTVNRLRGTSLGCAAELDELCDLNSGERDGEHNELVKALIAAAIAGVKVSAIKARAPFVEIEFQNRQLELKVKELLSEIEDLKETLATAQTYPGGEPFIRASEILRRALSCIGCSVAADISRAAVALHESEALNALRGLNSVLAGAGIDEVTIIHQHAKERRCASTRKRRKRAA